MKWGFISLSLVCATCSSFAHSSSDCSIRTTESKFKNSAECLEVVFNVPLLDTPPRSSGPELSASNQETISTAQKIELDRLMKLAAQSENPSKASASTKAAQANAAWIMGLLVLHGRGVPADVKRAKYWFQVAWQRGEPMASAGLAWCEMVGCGMPPDYAKARYWRAQLAKINRGRALYFEWLARSQSAPLARKNDLDATVDADKTPHYALLVDAANAGDIQAHIELGITSAAHHRLSEALKHFVYVESNSHLISNNAAYIQELIANSKQQSELMQSNLGKEELAEYYWNQARRYHQGDGLPVNYIEAIRLYKKAADLGNLKAKKMLDLIFSQSFDGAILNIPWMQKLSRMNMYGLTPQLPTVDGPVLLLREETGLTDFIPRLWNAPSRASKTGLQPCQPEIAPC